MVVSSLRVARDFLVRDEERLNGPNEFQVDSLLTEPLQKDTSRIVTEPIPRSGRIRKIHLE
jgi:hypothetical protein